MRKTTCQCKEYFDSDTVYSNIVIQPSVLHEGVNWYADSDESFLEPYTVRVEFPKDEDKDEFVHTFKFQGEVTFTYMPEGSTPGEWADVTLHESSEVNDPVMLEQAVRSMNKKDLAAWMNNNAGIKIGESYIESEIYLLQEIDL